MAARCHQPGGQGLPGHMNCSFLTAAAVGRAVIDLQYSAKVARIAPAHTTHPVASPAWQPPCCNKSWLSFDSKTLFSGDFRPIALDSESSVRQACLRRKPLQQVALQ